MSQLSYKPNMQTNCKDCKGAKVAVKKRLIKCYGWYYTSLFKYLGNAYIQEVDICRPVAFVKQSPLRCLCLSMNFIE